MRLRPAPAHWFETYVPRNQTVYALDTLAATGRVQLELDTRLAEPLVLKPVRDLIHHFQRLCDGYDDCLPVPGRSPAGQVEAPERTARQALDCLQAWRVPVDALLEQRRQLEQERRNLELLRECITVMTEGAGETDHLSQKAEFIYKGVFACPHSLNLAPDVCDMIDELVEGREHNFFIVVDEPACRERIETAWRSQSCLLLQIPAWLPSRPQEQLSGIAVRLAEIEQQGRAIQQALQAKKDAPDVADALANIELLDWFLEQSPQVATAGKLCHVSGWTTVDDVEDLQQALHRAGIHAVIRFASPPGFSRVPVNMRLSWWARPFLFIVEMLGTPDSTEIDSSKLLPFIVPLLFGYMFPDVGHGLMLVLFSALLYRRWPAGRFLIPCGFSAMAFGVVFGEVFGVHGVIEPLWISPLDNPLDVLLAPLLFGIGLILLGLVFSGAEALWRDETREWLLGEAALLVLYPAALVGLFVHELLWVALLALLWFLLGQWLIASTDRLAHLGRGLGLLLQSVFELAVNTLSFLRVGAFALAHAALSTAVLGIADAIANEVLHALFLVIGHLFIVALEGLVVFVQTTRLVLLEFFIRFLRAEGRKFHPLIEVSPNAGDRK